MTVLNSILVRLSDDLPKLQPVATATARRILGQHLGAVYALLGMKNKSGQIKVALRLLMAMVLQGADMARLVVMQFDLSHYTIAPLLQRRDAKVGKGWLTHWLLEDVAVILKLLISNLLLVHSSSLCTDCEITESREFLRRELMGSQHWFR